MVRCLCRTSHTWKARAFVPAGGRNVNYLSAFCYSLLAVTSSLSIALSSGFFQRYIHMSIPLNSLLQHQFHQRHCKWSNSHLKSFFIVSKKNLLLGWNGWYCQCVLEGGDSCILCFTGLLERKPYQYSGVARCYSHENHACTQRI